MQSKTVGAQGDIGHSVTPIAFSHANSFPAGTYRKLFSALGARGLNVHAVDRFGHDPEYPVTDNWPHLVQQLQDFVAPLAAKDGPVWLVGHSLGGFLSIMLAAQAPQLARGVLLLDAPLLGGWRARALGVAKTARLVGSVSPGAISRKRRERWATRDDALTHFRSKRAFAAWDPEVLQDYVNHGTLDDVNTGDRVLGFRREVETAIYNTLPHHLPALLGTRPPACPVAFIGGTHSQELRQVGMALTHRVTQGRVSMVDGSHLFPMEHPLVTAAAIDAALLNLDSVVARAP